MPPSTPLEALCTGRPECGDLRWELLIQGTGHPTRGRLMTRTRGQVVHEGPRAAWTQTSAEGTASEMDACEGDS